MSLSFGWDVGDGRRSGSEGGKQGPEEVAERPSQNPTEARRNCVHLKAGTSTRGVERAAGASGCCRGTKRVLASALAATLATSGLAVGGWPVLFVALGGFDSSTSRQ